MKDYAERLRMLEFPDITSQVVVLSTAKYIEDLEQQVGYLRNKMEAMANCAQEDVQSKDDGHCLSCTPDGLCNTGTHCVALEHSLQDCPECGPSGIEATDGSGPYDCWACGKMALPQEFDVRTILLGVVPGDGSGLEIYAKDVADVERMRRDLINKLECAECLAETFEGIANVKQFKPWQKLWDTQWTNIVNHDHCWESYSKEDAVHEAVKMTEAKLKENNTYVEEI